MKGYLGIEKEEQSRAGGALSWCTPSSLSTELVELSSLSTPLSLPVAQWPQVRDMAAGERVRKGERDGRSSKLRGASFIQSGASIASQSDGCHSAARGVLY
ncbi:hypothetical protein Dimus_025171 [Dionaea muscipula]